LAAGISALLTSDDDASAESTADYAAAVRDLHRGRVEFQLLDQPTSFDERQAEIHALPLPLIVVGCAGVSTLLLPDPFRPTSTVSGRSRSSVVSRNPR
jgi:hypothetical protein